MYDLLLKHGKAWRVQEHVLGVIMEDVDHAYADLPLFMNELQEKNFGTVIGI